jgi:hypothetical protein
MPKVVAYAAGVSGIGDQLTGRHFAGRADLPNIGSLATEASRCRTLLKIEVPQCVPHSDFPEVGIAASSAAWRMERPVAPLSKN